MALHNVRSRFFESIEDAVDDLTAFIEAGWSTSAVISSRSVRVMGRRTIDRQGQPLRDGLSRIKASFGKQADLN